MRVFGLVAGLVLLAAPLLVSQPVRAAGYNESCSAGNQCEGDLTCQPGVHKCYNTPRQYGEPCVAGYECGDGLSCQPGLQVCLHDPRWPGEACAAGHPCDVDAQCASATQICERPQERGSGDSCDAVTRQCGNNLSCDFVLMGPVPLAGTGKCTSFPADGDWITPANDMLTSEMDSEADTAHPGSRPGGYKRITALCQPGQLLVGISASTDFYNRVVTTRGRENDWETFYEQKPVCVDTNDIQTWTSKPQGEQRETPRYGEGWRVTNLSCPFNTWVKRITGTYGGVLFSTWNEDDFLYSLQVECSDGSIKGPIGGLQHNGPTDKTFALECPSERYVATGIWYNVRGFTDTPGDEQIVTELSHKLKVGDEDITSQDGSPLGVFVINNGLTLSCTLKTKLYADAAKAKAAKAAEPTPTPAPVPTGGGTRLGNLPGEKACNTYMDGRRIPQEDNRPISESERLELCKGAEDEAEAARRIQCFGDSILQGVEGPTATFNCGRGQGPAPSIPPSWPPPEPAIWQADAEPEAPQPPGDQPEPGMEDEPSAPGPGASVSEEQRCMDMLEGRVPWTQQGDTHWEESSKPQLCAGATNADERIACFTAGINAGKNWSIAAQECREGITVEPLPGGPEPVEPSAEPSPEAPPQSQACDTSLEETCKSYLQDQVPWSMEHPDDPDFRHWQEENMTELCRCTTDPGATVQCFQDRLYNNGRPISWDAAIAACKAR